MALAAIVKLVPAVMAETRKLVAVASSVPYCVITTTPVVWIPVRGTTTVEAPGAICARPDCCAPVRLMREGLAAEGTPEPEPGAVARSWSRRTPVAVLKELRTN